MIKITLKEYWKELFVILMTLISIFHPIISPTILFLVLLYLQIKKCSLIINAYTFIVFFRTIIGSLLIGEYGIKGFGGLVYIIGIFLLIPYFIKDFHTIRKGLYVFIIICLYFLISCMSNGYEQIPLQKWTTFSLDGIVYYLLLCILFLRRRDINYYQIAIYSIAWSFILLYIVEKTSNLIPPINVFDVGFYRFQVQDFMYDMELERGAIFLHYQVFGFFALLGMTLMMMQNLERKKQNTFVVICIILTFLLTLYTGARQFIIINAVLTLLFVALGLKNIKAIVFTSILIFIIIATGSLGIFDLLFENVNESGVIEGSGRLPLVEKAYKDIENFPIFGIGFGHFNLKGIYCFPHNIFLEILSTTGFVGMFFLILTFIFYNKDIWISIFKNKYGYWIYPFIFLLLRACISQPLESNVILFSFILAIPYIKYQK